MGFLNRVGVVLGFLSLFILIIVSYNGARYVAEGVLISIILLFTAIIFIATKEKQ
jgi:hypothetical protein